LLIRKVQDEDRDVIVKKIEKSSGYPCFLAVLLSRAFKTEPSLKRVIREKWGKTNEYIVKRGLVARLLDDPEISVSEHESIFAFIRENWDRYLSDISSKFMKETGVLAGVRKSLEERNMPESKHWAYLLILARTPAQEKDEARTICKR